MNEFPYGKSVLPLKFLGWQQTGDDMNYLKDWKKINPYYLLKTGFGSAVAILIADSIGLLYSPSAGIITLLTIQNTKKETLSIAVKRLESFLLAVFLTYILFVNIGYTPIAFGIFVVLFVAFCLMLGLKDGIAMNSVLMTHFLVEKRMDFPLLINELSILAIGMGIGIILNLIMPRNIRKIREQQLLLETVMKGTLHGLAFMMKQKDACLIQQDACMSQEDACVIQKDECLIQKDVSLIQQDACMSQEDAGLVHKDKYLARKAGEIKLYNLEKRKVAASSACKEQVNGIIVGNSNIGDEPQEVDFVQLDSLLEKLLKSAYEEAANTFQNDTRYLISYLEMRKLQVGVLKDMKDNIESVPVILKQTFSLAGFMENIADSFHERNNVKMLLEDLEKLKDYFRQDQLPQTREEFEYRAVLFQILKELEYFLVLKRNFILELDEKHLNYYWQ